MTTLVYRDPQNLEEAMRELRPLRKTAERLRAENATLREELRAHGEEAAKLQSQLDAMLALEEVRKGREEREKRLGIWDETAGIVNAAWVDRKYEGLVGWHVSLLPPDGTQLYMFAAPKPE